MTCRTICCLPESPVPSSMDTAPPPPYHEAVNSAEQPTEPTLQNGDYPKQNDDVIHPGQNGVSFGEDHQCPPPPVTTQPVVTAKGVLVEERGTRNGCDKKKKKHCCDCRDCRDCRVCDSNGCDCSGCDCKGCNCSDCRDCGDCKGCDCGGCDCGGCDCGGCVIM
ncbi:keratin-associated protein 5-2-like [Branchiostoma floridae]|uniref:Keratin-associated protein 5-2-like n=1 Tax=Branchiostoma floridae TaxID=7739 RepID=A0A9J7MKP6_BRAFL|nr:keratin-associated protein 5-2-like [Branchiostoma floridae]